MRSSSRLQPRASVRLLALITAALLAACSSGETASTDSESTTTEASTVAPTELSTTAETTTTLAATTTTEAPEPVFPLTGLPVADPLAALRPAVVVKVGNYDSHPQRGTNLADIVYEEIINADISRFAMVYQSQAAPEVGPIRSGRRQDIDLFGPYNRPIFAWAGGNRTVTDEIEASDLIDLSQFHCQGTCYRGGGERAPFDLFFDVTRIWTVVFPDAGSPPPQFLYREAGEPVAGTPSAGVGLNMESYDIDWTWNAGTGLYERMQNGRLDKDANGELVTTNNVVVLAMTYLPGISDSPDAQSIGSGEAFVFSGGNKLHGTWSRTDRLQPFTLIDDAGNPIELTPGRTFIELPRADNTIAK